MDIPKSSSYAATVAIGGSCSLKLKLSWHMPWLLRRPLSSQCSWHISSGNLLRVLCTNKWRQIMPQEHLQIASNRRLHCEAARADAFCSGCKKVGAVACEAPTQWFCWAVDIPKSSSYAATVAIGGSCSLKLKLSWHMPWLLRRPLSSQKWDASSFTSCCQACREPRLFVQALSLYQTFVFPQYSHRLVALKLCFAWLHVTLVVLEGWIATELLEGLTEIDETC